jgi:hypothetical protein
MEYVGFLCLGLFVGCVAVLGFQQAQTNFTKGATAILAAALGGVAIGFVDKLIPVASSRDSIFMYPVGLFVAIPWIYMRTIVELWNEQKDTNGNVVQRRHPVMTILALIGMLVVNVLAMLLAFSPRFRKFIE